MPLLETYDQRQPFIALGREDTFLKCVSTRWIRWRHQIYRLALFKMLKWIKIDVSLGEGDLFIMMSDGIIEKREDHVFERIQHLTTTDPQAIADFLLDEAILDNKQIIADDMTVIVARLDRFKSKWQTIPYQAIEQYSYG